MTLTKYQKEFYDLDVLERIKWRTKALSRYDTVMFCPGCRRLLTGLHENNRHFQDIVSKEAAKMWRDSE